MTLRPIQLRSSQISDNTIEEANNLEKFDASQTITKSYSNENLNNLDL